MPPEKEVTKCRVCGDLKLIGWYGLCQSCQDATVDFWRIRKQELGKRGVWGDGKAKS